MPGMNTGMRLRGVGAVAQIVHAAGPKMKQAVETYLNQQIKKDTATIEVDAATDVQAGQPGVNAPPALAASQTALGTSLSTLSRLTGQPMTAPPAPGQAPAPAATGQPPQTGIKMGGERMKSERVRSAIKTQIKKMMKEKMGKG